MPDMMAVLAGFSQCVEPTMLRQLGRVIEALLSTSGRVTMKGLSRWSDKGGSYRTIQRFFNTPLNGLQLNWLLIRHHWWEAHDVALMSGDHVVVTQSGKNTHGLDRFFSSLYGKVVPGLCFLSLSWLSVKHRTSYSVVTKPEDKRLEVSVQAAPRQQKKPGGPRGRPKGSQHRNRREVELSPSLCFIQTEFHHHPPLLPVWLPSVYGRPKHDTSEGFIASQVASGCY